jgi:hypothetical protein
MKRSLATLTVVPAAATALLGLAAPASARTIPVPSRTALHWGRYFGDHKSGDADQAGLPAPITLPAPVRQLSTSNSTQYALLTNGQVWAWGQGTNGELGDGADANSFNAAVRVHFPRGVTIAFLPRDANPYDSGLAVDTSGHAWGWGLNLHGEFCNGSTRATDVPERIPLPGPVTTLAGANAHVIYDAGGTVYACGANYRNQDALPVPVKSLPSRVAVSELVSGFGDSGALLANGQYYDGSSGPSRTASSTAVHDVRPGSSAAITEYGQPGIICACPFPRP